MNLKILTDRQTVRRLLAACVCVLFVRLRELGLDLIGRTQILHFICLKKKKRKAGQMSVN